MPFHSPAFLLLCLLTLGLYYLGGARWQHALLLLSSLVFYYYAGIVDTALLLSAVGLNHLAAAVVTRRDGTGRRALALTVAANLLLLGYFKYRGMLVLWANHLLGLALPVPALVIPLGISFYLFQLIAYQVDLYRGLLQREPRFWRTLLYILFFPHHQAGPIMRPAKFLPQFYGRKPFHAALVASGGLWVLFGLCKKVCADHLAAYVEPGFADPGAVEGAAGAWALALAYALQIYGDFSGYSDIAVGLGRLFGYELDRNFDQPYLAASPSEFWRRWHITLSSWLRDYLYIPLGGNRLGEGRTYANLLLTMVLGGLWHGASLLFLLWGLCHGLLLVAQRLWPRAFALRPLGWALTFGVTVIAWVLFRAPNWATAEHLLLCMAGRFGPGTARGAGTVLLLIAATLLTQALEDLALHSGERRARTLALWLRVPAPLRGALLAAVVVGIVCLLVDNTAYIYFRF